MDNTIGTGGTMNKSVFATVMIILAIACQRQHKTVPSASKYKLVWSDEFNETVPDTSKWTFEQGTGYYGWGNNELEYYTDRPENIGIQDGDLVIEARKEDYKGSRYTSARIKTAFKGDWKYGKVEARIKLPVGQGIWPAFWMMPTDKVYGGWPKSGEIDIMEMIGKNPSTTYGTVHFGEKTHHYKGGKYTLPKGILHDGFHNYAIEWQPDKIQWLFDGKSYYQVTPDSLKPDLWPFSQRFYIILNLAVGGQWPGDPDSTTVFPQKMLVDYVRVYQESKK